MKKDLLQNIATCVLLLSFSITGYAQTPVYQSSVVNNASPTRLEMTYNVTLANITPAASSFTVLVNAGSRTVTAVAISGTKVLLFLPNPVVHGDIISVSYTRSAINPIQAITGEQAGSLGSQTVTNSVTADIPVYNDIEGNSYDAIGIGYQIWMKENLKTTKFSDGTSISNVTDDASWSALTSAAYCWYNNDAADYKATYGALYNWYAVDGASNGGKNLCPTGWHVPSDDEWTTLSDFLGGESVAGGELKEAGTEHWISPNTGTNESGFTALPAGVRYNDGTFTGIEKNCNMWSSTAYHLTQPWAWFIYNYQSNFDNTLVDKEDGYTVRCLQNVPPIAEISGTTEVCKNAVQPQLTFTGITGTPPFTFTYSINGGSNQTVTTTSGNSYTIYAATDVAGTYTYSLLSVQDAYSTVAQTGSAVVTVNSLPTANAGAALSAICLGGTSAPLGGSVGGSATGGIWSTPVGGNFSPNATSLNATWTPPGTYSGTATLTLTTSGGSCGISTANKPITVNPIPAITAITTTVCSGAGFGIAPVNGTNGTVPAGTTYSWAAPVVTGGITGGEPGSGQSAIIAVLTNTTNAPQTAIYTVTPTTGSCAGTTFKVTITVNPLPSAPISGGDKSYCQSGTIPTVSASVDAGQTVNWYTASIGGNLIISGNLSFTPSAPGTYFAVDSITTTGCVSSSRTPVLVTMNPLPIPTLKSSDADNIFCSGTSVTFTAGGGTSYNFNIGGLSVQNSSSPTYTSNSLTNGQVVDVTVTNNNGCIATSAGITNIINALPIATALSNGTLIPGSSLSLIGGPGGMSTYSWSGPNGFSSALQSPVVSTNAIPEMAGVYTLTVTNSSGCQNSATTIVASNPLIVTNVNDIGIGSLRYAMNYANSTIGVTDIITFSIPGYGPFTIQPQTALPAITDPVIIDGYSQPGASATSPLLLIEIDGTYAGTGSNGLTITSGNCTLKGLIINRFSGSGIQISGSGANSIVGNYIGLDYSGTVAKGNTADGIHISGSSNNKIGSDNPGGGNVISANNGAGISIIGNGAIGNQISSNSIYSNGLIGIDLGGNGLTPNDTGDPDTGPGNLQNFPVLGTATFGTGSVTISGTLNSAASKTYNLQFFASVLADNTGYGEGQSYLGSKSVTTSSSGDASFSQAFAIKSSSGTVITATATDPNGNTSEFSKAIGGYQDQKVASANWPLKYTLNADGVPNITDGSDLSAVRAAFNTWAAITTAKIQFTDGGTTTSKYANAADGVNLVSFEDDQFPFSYGVLAVAAKTLQVDPVTNIAQIIDADIVVNPDFVNDIKYNLGIVDNTKNRGYFDIQSVITHEIGHVVGLLHSSVEGATMFFTMGSGTKVRTLEQDDKSWASYLYPADTYNSTYGSISGNITYGYGAQPVAGAIVYAISASRQDSVHAYSDAQGNYLVPGLIPGSYNIYIEPLDGDVNGYNLRPGNISPYIYANTVYTDYPGEFYNKPDLADEPNDSKLAVTVTAGSNTPGVNLITNKDDIRPTVVSVSPTDVSGSLVNITSNFSIKFSEAVDEPSLSTATCYFTAGSITIGGSYTFLGNNVILFDPEAVLDYGTNYTLHITTGITDLRGNPLLISSGGQEQPEFTQSFMTVSKDNVQPEINEVIPANGATGVFVSDKIMVFFSEPMNKSSVEKGFVLSSGGLVISGSFSWDDANMTVTFSPFASLKEAKTVYTITLPISITDLSGNPLPGSTYSFTTVATAPPTIIYLGPANNSTGVPVTTPIVVDFSEPINTYTVTSTTFKLLLGGTGTTIPGQFEFLNENSRVVFTPAANLNFNQSYTISLTAGIQDVSTPTSSSLKASSSTFTTAATITVPDILYLDPSNGVAGDKVVITGTGFNPNPAKNVVTFNGLNATVTFATLTSLTTVVPQGALSGPVSVTVNGTASDNTMYFGVIPQSLNPCSNILGSKSTGSSSGHDVGLTDAVSVSGVHSTYAYVTNPDHGTVSVVNLTTSETISPITVGDTPMNIAINPQGTKAYVTNFNSHTVSVIDLTDGINHNKVIATIPVGIEPYGVAVTPNGKRVYVANYYSENVSMIDEDPSSGGFDHVTANVSTGSRNGSAAATADGAMVLVAGDFGLKIIDSNPADKSYNSVTANVSTGSKANGVTATGDAALAIVSTEDGHLLMINLHPENGNYSEAIIANVSTGTKGGKVNASGDNLFVYLPDTKNNQILVYQIGIGTGGSGSTNGSGVSGLTFIPHNTIPIPTAPVALAISADASRLYVLDTKTGTSNNEITSVAICCGPITPAKTIGDLIIAIQDMINTGDITKLRGYALIISLNSALRNINAKRPNLAIIDLTAFNALVNTYIKNKQITSAQGNALVNSATALINQLKGTKSALAGSSITDTAQLNQELIPVSALGVIYPNPFSQSVTINYNVTENKESLTKIQIMVYDENGRLVSTLIDKMMEQGCYTVEWKGTYGNGGQVPYGSYYVQFRAGYIVEVRKIILIKPR